MSDRKMTTSCAMDAAFEGQFRRRFLREMWFPVLVTVACMASPLLVYGFTREALPHVANGLVFAVVIWGFAALSVQRDIVRAKYSMLAGKLDTLLETVDAHWTWCEDTQSYAIHLVADPHEVSAEETEEPSKDSVDDTK